MSVLSAIGNFFKKIFGFTVKSQPFKVLVADLLPTAVAVVTELAKVSTLSSAEKRNAALAQLKTAAEQRGLEFADHMLALIVETAVAKLKGTLE
jgi:hypothetical protein